MSYLRATIQLTPQLSCTAMLKRVNQKEPQPAAPECPRVFVPENMDEVFFDSHEECEQTMTLIADWYEREKADWRKRIPDLERLPPNMLVLSMTIVLMRELQDQKKPLQYTLREYARRMLHVFGKFSTPVNAMVCLEFLMSQNVKTLDHFFDKIVQRSAYQPGEDVPDDLRIAIERLEQRPTP